MLDSIEIRKQNLISFLDLYWNDPGLAFWRAYEAELLSGINLKNNILDLGCGDGSFTKQLLLLKEKAYQNNSNGYNLIGIEITSSLVFSVSKNENYNNLIRGDIQNVGFKNNSFDTVFSNCVLEHIKDINKCLSEISRILRQNGELYITVINDKFSSMLLLPVILKKLSLYNLALKIEKRRNEQLFHVNCYSLNWWKEMLKQYNLDVKDDMFYMDYRSMIIWDMLFTFVRLRIGRINIAGVLSYIARKLDGNKKHYFKWAIKKIIFMILWPFYKNGKCKDGCAMLIVAKKNNDTKTIFSK